MLDFYISLAEEEQQQGLFLATNWCSVAADSLFVFGFSCVLKVFSLVQYNCRCLAGNVRRWGLSRTQTLQHRKLRLGTERA